MTPEEIALMVQAFQLLEPHVQTGISNLVHHLKPQPKMTAEGAIAEAQKEIDSGIGAAPIQPEAPTDPPPPLPKIN